MQRDFNDLILASPIIQMSQFYIKTTVEENYFTKKIHNQLFLCQQNTFL